MVANKSTVSNMRVNLRHVVAELIGMTLFVYIGTGAAVFFSNIDATDFVTQDGTVNARNANVAAIYSNLTINSSFGIMTALAFGMAIMVAAFSIGHVSGCHLNPAVTLSLVCSGNCGLGQAIANVLAQLAGATLGSLLLWGTTSMRGSGLGANAVDPQFSRGNAVLGEIVMTLVLCYVVHLTAVDKRNTATAATGLAPIAIGFAVFLGHAVLIPLDGCSINPARSFGPALVANRWQDFWVFVVGPLVGAVLAVPCFLLVSHPWEAKRGAPSQVVGESKLASDV